MKSALVVIQRGGSWPSCLLHDAGACIALSQQRVESHAEFLSRTLRRVEDVRRKAGPIPLAILACCPATTEQERALRAELAEALLAATRGDPGGRLVLHCVKSDLAVALLGLAGGLMASLGGGLPIISVVADAARRPAA